MKIKSALEQAKRVQTELDKLHNQRAQLVADHNKALAIVDAQITDKRGQLSVVIDMTLQNVS